MNKVVHFDRNRKRRSPPSGRNSPARDVNILIAGGIVAADRYQFPHGLMFGVIAGKADTLRTTFPYCSDAQRVTCVVDGDTFWLEGEKIRISDIDTPELSPPRCEAERVKGEAAKRRLRERLNTGPFSLASGWRDEDQHERKLRTVTRIGRSIGDLMIEEGLARRWDGSRRSWCD